MTLYGKHGRRSLISMRLEEKGGDGWEESRALFFAEDPFVL